MRIDLFIRACAVLACLTVGCGCATHRTLELDEQHPAVRVTTRAILFGERPVQMQEVPEILDDYDIPRDRVIHILLDPDVKDLRPARLLMGCLGRSGYTRCVLVTKRHAESINVGKRPKKGAVGSVTGAGPKAKKQVIRYKRADE